MAGGGAQLRAISPAVPASSILLLLSDEFSSEGAVGARCEGQHPCSPCPGRKLACVQGEQGPFCETQPSGQSLTLQKLLSAVEAEVPFAKGPFSFDS